MTRPALTFLGGAGTVTGSRFLVESSSSRVLVDAGLYQGLPELRRRNWDPFPVDPSTVGAIVVTHAHLDHTGYLPRLVRDGFRGRIVCTPETAELAAIVLRDSAHLQEEDAAYANAVGFSKHRPALPLYGGEDVERTLPLLAPTPYDEPVALRGGPTAVLRPAGHILGSAIVRLEVEGHRVLFSGDLGRPRHPLLAPRSDPLPADTIVVESTYGDRAHPEPDASLLAAAVRRTVRRGGTVLVPAFAVDRTELVLLELARLTRDGQIPKVPVFVDSPMALAALEVYRRALGRAGRRHGGHDPFDPGDLRVVRDPEESRGLNSPPYPCIVISASGMGSGGRVVHHLAHQLPDPRNTVVLTGYQAEGTRGRRLLDGARELKIHGRYVPVRADVVRVEDFSVHSDADETLAWLRAAKEPPTTTYVVHGERSASAALARRITDELGWCATVPTVGERVLLD